MLPFLFDTFFIGPPTVCPALRLCADLSSDEFSSISAEL